MSNTGVEFYTTRSYLEKNPLWHTEESCWKAEHVLRMINRYKIVPRTICEVGCGASATLAIIACPAALARNKPVLASIDHVT